MADGNNIAYTRFHDNFGDYTTPVFLRQSYKIWGLTAVVLHETLRAIIPEVYNVKFSVTRAGDYPVDNVTLSWILESLSTDSLSCFLYNISFFVFEPRTGKLSALIDIDSRFPKYKIWVWRPPFLANLWAKFNCFWTHISLPTGFMAFANRCLSLTASLNWETGQPRPFPYFVGFFSFSFFYIDPGFSMELNEFVCRVCVWIASKVILKTWKNRGLIVASWNSTPKIDSPHFFGKI